MEKIRGFMNNVIDHGKGLIPMIQIVTRVPYGGAAFIAIPFWDFWH